MNHEDLQPITSYYHCLSKNMMGNSWYQCTWLQYCCCNRWILLRRQCLQLRLFLLILALFSGISLRFLCSLALSYATAWFQDLKRQHLHANWKYTSDLSSNRYQHPACMNWYPHLYSSKKMLPIFFSSWANTKLNFIDLIIFWE